MSNWPTAYLAISLTMGIYHMFKVGQEFRKDRDLSALPLWLFAGVAAVLIVPAAILSGLLWPYTVFISVLRWWKKRRKP